MSQLLQGPPIKKKRKFSPSELNKCIVVIIFTFEKVHYKMMYFSGKTKACLCKEEEFPESNTSSSSLAEMLG